MLFCGLVLLFIVRVCHAFLFVHCSAVVTCWEMANLFALMYVMLFVLCHFYTCGVLGKTRYLIVLISDLSLLTYFLLFLVSNIFARVLCLVQVCCK